MDWIVTTARTVEEAQTRALDLLGVDSADAEIQVVEEGKTGLFGRTKSEARVRARIKPKAPPAKDERRQGRGGDRSRGRNKGSNKGGGGRNKGDGNRSDGNRGDSNRGDSNKSDGNRSDGNKGGGGRNRDGGNRSKRESNRDGGTKDGARSDKVGAAASGGGNDRDEGGRGDRNRNDRDRNRNRNDRGNSRNRGSRNNEDRVEMPVEEQRETLETFVTGVAKAFDPEAKVTLVEEGTTLLAEVTGTDLGRMVGNKASTLQSLEELSRTAMHRAAAGRRYHRIQVDVDQYRARRREALAKFATDLAATVAETGESKAMEPMGAADRKLIHDAVSDVDGVETVSEGRDPRRYIVLLATNASDEEE